MSKKKIEMAERIELPNISNLTPEDIPQQAGILSPKERSQKLRTRKNVEEVSRSVIRGVDENNETFCQVENFQTDVLPELLERRQRLQPIREKLEEALYVITDAELINNDQIQRVLLRAHEVVTAMETLNPGIARDFIPLREYMKTNDGKTQRAKANTGSNAEKTE